MGEAMTPEEKRRAAELLRDWADWLEMESRGANKPQADEHRDLAAKLEAEAGG